MPDDLKTASELSGVLKQKLGADGLSDDLNHREFMSQDIWAKGATAAFVAAPESLEEMQAAVRAAHERGISLNPRGGGYSYTKGYTPDRDHVGILDMSRLNKIIEINTEDMYVTVQAGVTWAQLYEALKPHRVRTPFWGPLSGIGSTIGGGLSQNNAFFGAGKYGTTGESLLSISVVLADGTLVRTGTGGTKNGKPFWRYYGPDLTGLFCGDAGALGYKAEATFRLIPLPKAEETASFEFSSRDACAEAMAQMMREDIACEIFGFDPNLTKVRLARASLVSDAKALTNVMKSQGSLLKGLREGAKVALAGRGFMDKVDYSLHVCVEGRSKTGVKEDIQVLKDIVAKLGGKEIENSIPKIIRANPFGPMNNILGPQGERWVPIHGIVPTSEGPATWAEIEAGFAAMSDELEQHDILTGFLITSLGTTGYLIEPVFLWPEEVWPIHEDTVGADWMNKIQRHKANPEATEVVAKARQVVLDVFSKRGGAHFQIGRTYPFKEGREESTWKLVEAIKQAVDEKGIVNPGALGLG
ncbi:MAG: FAD-binding oxidoreductase [Pseudomonadota bacterium]